MNKIKRWTFVSNSRKAIVIFSALLPQELNDAMSMPSCTYSVHSGAVDWPAIAYANVGETVSTCCAWDCIIRYVCICVSFSYQINKCLFQIFTFGSVMGRRWECWLKSTLWRMVTARTTRSSIMMGTFLSWSANFCFTMRFSDNHNLRQNCLLSCMFYVMVPFKMSWENCWIINVDEMSGGESQIS